MLDLHHEPHVGTSSAVDFLIDWKSLVVAAGTLIMVRVGASLSHSRSCSRKAPPLGSPPTVSALEVAVQ